MDVDVNVGQNGAVSPEAILQNKPIWQHDVPLPRAIGADCPAPFLLVVLLKVIRRGPSPLRWPRTKVASRDHASC